MALFQISGVVPSVYTYFMQYGTIALLRIVSIVLSLLVFNLLLFLVFLVLKIDRGFDWSWSVVFSPVWVAEVVVIVSIVLIFLEAKKLIADPTPAFCAEFRFAGPIFVLLVLLSVFVVIRLDSVVAWPWAFVLVPYWVAEAVLAVSSIASIKARSAKQNEPQPTLSHLALAVYDEFKWSLCRLLFSIFLVLQADGVVSFSSFFVWLPLSGGLSLVCIFDVFRDAQLPPSENEAVASSRQTDRILKVVLLSVVSGFVFLVWIVPSLVVSDEAKAVSLALVFIPLFCCLGCLCPCCCGLSFVVGLSSDESIKSFLSTVAAEHPERQGAAPKLKSKVYYGTMPSGGTSLRFKSNPSP